MWYKVCTKCQQGYPPTTDYFYKDCTKEDGLYSWCKGCVAIRRKVYQKTHKEAINGYLKKYRQTETGKAVQKQAGEKYNATIKGHLNRVFSGMKQRCTNSACKNYKNYGGRGIKICFESATEFINYVINELKVDPRGLQIDRIDNDGNYERGNIRFVTCRENNLNKRNCLCA